LNTDIAFYKNQLKSRRWIICAVVLACLSIAICFVPQVNLLNYFFSLVVAFPLSIVTGLCAVRAATERSGSNLRTILMGTLLSTLTLALIPLALVSCAAMFVKNCDYWTGLKFYFMGPVLGSVCAASVGLFSGAIAPKRWMATLGFVTWWIVLLLLGFLHFYRHPPIFAYNTFVGFFSGAIYDHFIEITGTYLLYRLNTLLVIALFCCAIAVALRRQWTTGLRVAIGLLLAIQVAVFFTRSDLGFETTREHIAETLGGRIETAHFVIYYDKDGPLANQELRRAFARDHEFRFSQLKSILGVAPDQKIRSFIYSSRPQKKKLMGADRTFIAKPWLLEMHLNQFALGAPVLKHELAHVFGAAISDGWLGLPTQYGLIPKMAIVEGFAEAMTWAGGRLTLHQWSAAMAELGIGAPMDRILGATGFIGAHTGQAYTLSGSFLRYLMDTHGTDKLKTLYATGNLEETYGHSTSDLISSWRGFLSDRSRVPLSDADRKLTTFRYDAPGFFSQVCALETARWAREASVESSEGNFGEALELRQKILASDPNDPFKHFAVLQALISAGKLKDARQTAVALSTNKKASQVLRTAAKGRLGDIYWLQGEHTKAAITFNEISRAATFDNIGREYDVRVQVLKWPADAAHDAVRNYLVGPAKTHEDAVSLLEPLSTGRPIVSYLLARRYFGQQEYAKAEQQLLGALKNGLHPRKLKREALRLAGVARLISNNSDGARALFERALPFYQSRGDINRIRDWIARGRFFASSGQ
jgi:tetratricopeptide (TPR) repeat protein